MNTVPGYASLVRRACNSFGTSRNALFAVGFRCAIAFSLLVPQVSTSTAAEEVRITYGSDAEAAWQAWEAMPNKADARVLDRFISEWPSSDAAALALTLRHALLKTANSEEPFYQFIVTYSGTYFAEQAHYELFQRVRKRDALASYAEFVRRLPGSPLSQVAMMHVSDIAFRTAREENSIETFEGYALGFPGTAQVQAALDSATQLALKEERLIRQQVDEDASLTDMEKRAKHEARASVLITEWFGLFEKFNDRWGFTDGQFVGLPSEQQRLAARAVVSNGATDGELLLDMHRVRRKRESVFVYKDLPLVADFSVQLAQILVLEEVVNSLNDLAAQLRSQHEELLGAIETEFEQTRSAIRDGFHSVSQQIVAVGAQLDASTMVLTQRLDVLHDDLKQTQSQLTSIYGELDQINDALDSTNQRLDQIDTSVREVGNAVTKLNKDVSEKIGDLGDRIDGLREEVRVGLAQINESIGDLEDDDDGFGSVLGFARAGAYPLPLPSRKTLEHWGGVVEGNWKKVENSPVGQVFGGLVSLLNGKIIVFDFRTEAHFSVNRLKNTGSVQIEAPGVRLDASNIGNFNRPQLDTEGLLKLAVSSYGLRVDVSSQYHEVRERVLSDNPDSQVYVSSGRFVDWAATETGIGYIAEAILTGGASWEQAMAEGRQHLTLEVDDLTVFLIQAGIEQWEKTLARIAEAVITMSAPQAEIGGVRIWIENVPYEYRARVVGLSKLPLDAIASALPGPIGLVFSQELKKAAAEGIVVELPHIMFVVAISPGANAERTPTELAVAFRDRSLPEGAGSLPDTAEVFQSLFSENNVAFTALMNGYNIDDFVAQHSSDLVAGSLQEILDTSIGNALNGMSVDADEVTAPNGEFLFDGRFIDFRTPTTTANVRAFLSGLGLVWGNEGDVTLRIAEIDLQTQRCEISVEVRHRHVWKLSDISGKLRDFFVSRRLL